MEAPDELQTAGGLMGTPHGPALMVSFFYCGGLAHGERIAERWRMAAAVKGHRAGSAVWNDFHGAVTRVPIEASAFSLRRADPSGVHIRARRSFRAVR